MGKKLCLLLMCVVFIGQAYAVIADDPYDYQLTIEAEGKLVEFLPQLKILGEEYPDDTEIQVGLVFLYKSASRHTLIPSYSYDDQIETVLVIDPNNRTVWALKAKGLCNLYAAKRDELVDSLERRIDNAKWRGVEEVTIRKRSLLYQYLKEGGEDAVVIRDFDRAIQQLQEKFDAEVPEVLSMLNEGQSIDPDNAFYNYLKAYLYLKLGEKNRVVMEIEEAVAKKYLNFYSIEKNKAMSRVLQEVGFPQPYMGEIVEVYTPFLSNYYILICENGLMGAAKDLRKRQNTTLRNFTIRYRKIRMNKC